MIKIVKVLEGVHMGLGHDGLAKLIAKEAKVKIGELSKGELVLCMNGHGDKLKVIGHGGLVLGYLKLPKGQRIMKDALQYIPQTFGGDGFSYDAACRKALDDRFRGYPVKPSLAVVRNAG